MEQADWGAKATCPARANLIGIPCQHFAGEQVSVEDMRAVLEAYESKPRWVGSVCQVRPVQVYLKPGESGNGKFNLMILWGKDMATVSMIAPIPTAFWICCREIQKRHYSSNFKSRSFNESWGKTCVSTSTIPLAYIEYRISAIQNLPWAFTWTVHLTDSMDMNSGSWWWTGRPGVLQFMGLQRVGHDWATELNWCLWSKNRM